MLDDEKDLFIKKKIQQDKTISSKANDIFKNFENQILNSDDISDDSKDNGLENEPKVIELKTHSFFSRLKTFTTVAASFVVAVSVGAGVAIYGNVGIRSADGNSEYSSVNIGDSVTAGDYVVAEVKNEEVKVEQNKEKKIHENTLVKAVLMEDGSVAIQLKQELIKTYKLKLDTSKTYKVSGINGNVKDVFVCSMISKEFPYVLLLMDDGTVEVVQIFSEETMSNTGEYKFNFYDQGKIDGLKNIKGFEEKTEKLADSDKLFYYVNAIKNDGTRKIIDNIEYVNMSDVSKNKVTFRSQDGEKTFSITADKDKYVQGFGWAGASNNVYYINDNCLYHKNLTDGKEEKLITGVSRITTDDEGVIVAKVKFNHFIHEYNQYIKIEQYNVTESKVIDKKENENYILCLKEDGSITIELKSGAKSRIGAKEYFKENYIYNFYAGKYNIQVYNQYSNYDAKKQGINNYANATAIYLGKIGTKNKTCIAYATKNNEIVEVDIDLFVQKSVGGSFESEPGNDAYLINQGKQASRVKAMEEIVLKVELENGETKECTSIQTTNSDGTKGIIPVSSIVEKEGISNYKIINE